MLKKTVGGALASSGESTTPPWSVTTLLGSCAVEHNGREKMTAGLRFVDLFAGLGGFHQALAALGHRCVFASEIDENLAAIYERNFGIRPHGDIREISVNDIPEHDVLCAGFPCQPFSKAGEQKGLKCPQWGDLIHYVVSILKRRKPRFFIIENVPNLVMHNKGKTWAAIGQCLRDAGYFIDDQILSPHMFGVPQIRERAFIVGCREQLEGFHWPTHLNGKTLSIRSVLDRAPASARMLSERHVEYVSAWQEFLDLFPKSEDLPWFPIWAMEFGATYPYEDRTPHAVGARWLWRYRGNFGTPLKGLGAQGTLDALPSYARQEVARFPEWKINFIRLNREFYGKHKKLLKSWLPKIREFPQSFQKFEWHCKGEERKVWDHVLQFRASGIRVKRPTTAPSLVAMTTTQVPIVGWERRYMTARECSRLQSMGELVHLPHAEEAAFKALGNAVNVTVVGAIAKELLKVRAPNAKHYVARPSATAAISLSV